LSRKGNGHTDGDRAQVRGPTGEAVISLDGEVGLCEGRRPGSRYQAQRTFNDSERWQAKL
jgi:hypothetical protein